MQLTQNTLEELLPQIETDLIQRNFAAPGDKVLIMGGIPFGVAGSTNFLKIHTISGNS